MNFPVMVRYADCEDIFIDGAMRTVQLPVFNHLFGVWNDSAERTAVFLCNFVRL